MESRDCQVVLESMFRLPVVSGSDEFMRDADYGEPAVFEEVNEEISDCIMVII